MGVKEVFVSKNNIQSFLSYLAFEGYVLRIGLEISLTVFSHTILFQILTHFSHSPASAGMISWFVCCGSVMFLDKLILGHPADIFRQAYLCSLHGSYEKALELLSSIGPDSNSLIKLPGSSYHLHRAELLTQCKDFSAANLAFEMAENADPERLIVLKYRYYLEKNEFTQAELFLEESLKKHGETPVLLIEQGRSLLQTRKFWDASKNFKKAIEACTKYKLQNSVICSIAMAYLGICKLKTGHAEQGLEILDDTVSIIQAEMSFSDSLRPTLAEILCYRSHYLVTHRAPKEALLDLQYAMSICRFPYLTALIQDIKEELTIRYGI